MIFLRIWVLVLVLLGLVLVLERSEKRQLLLNLVLVLQHKKEAKDRETASQPKTPLCLGLVLETQSLNKDSKTGCSLSHSNLISIMIKVLVLVPILVLIQVLTVDFAINRERHKEN